MRKKVRRLRAGLLSVLAAGLLLADLASSPAADPGGPSSATGRFMAVLDGVAVKDAQTGLTWEQSPELVYVVWSEAIVHCREKRLGGQTGWRLPTIKELATLIDSSKKDPALPAGHPFGQIKSSIFWSSTPSDTDEMVAWHVSFFSGEVVTDQKSQTRRAWCLLANNEPRR